MYMNYIASELITQRCERQVSNLSYGVWGSGMHLRAYETDSKVLRLR